MKVGILTMQYRKNYGGVLQAYALYKVIESLGYDVEHIDFRYSSVDNVHFVTRIVNGFIRVVKLFRIKNKSRENKVRRDLPNEHIKVFSDFKKKYIKYSRPVYNDTIHEIINDYDCIVVGSDQIWNTNCFDFDWAYFLPFVENGKRIAYAPSMGPNPHKSVSETQATTIKRLLSNYKAISVREKETAERVKDFTGKDYPVMLDPTLLLSSADWSEIINEQPIIEGKYIFLYTPWFDEATFKTAQSLSQQLKLPIVVSQLYDGWKNNKWTISPEFRLHLATGPKEFLNLCKYATCIIGASFHLVVFSILLQVPFYTINGMKDSRIANLLSLTRLDSRSIDPARELDGLSLDMDFKNAIQRIERERARCITWLKQNIV